MIKLLITSDTHLDVYYRRLSISKLIERRNYIKKIFNQTVDFAIQKQVDFYIHAGDLFDLPNPRNTEISFVLDSFKRLKQNNIQTILIYGTHDTPKLPHDKSPLSIIESVGLGYIIPQKITEFSFLKNQRKVKICGIFSFKKEFDLRQAEFKKDCDFFIGLFHIGVESFLPPLYNEDYLFLKEIEESEFDMIVAGHLHRGSYLKINNKHLLIPGATERFNFGEIDNRGGFWYVEIKDNNEVVLEKVLTDMQAMQDIVVDFSQIKNINDPTSYIKEIIKQNSSADKFLRCRLKGNIDIDFFHKISIKQINDFGESLNFSFLLQTQDLRINTPYRQEAGSWQSISLKKILSQQIEEYFKKNPDEVLKEEVKKRIYQRLKI